MDDRELEALAADLESDRVERKESFRDKDRVCQAVCAFANDLPNHGKPGVLFIGVRDDGSCAHLRITDELLRELAGLRTDHQILPFPSIVVQKRVVRGCEVAVVIVYPADDPPVRYKGQVWVRTGPRRAIATPDQERRLSEKRRARDLPFDIRPFPSASLSDLDLELFRRVYLPAALPAEILQQNERTDEVQLASLRFLSLDPGAVPTTLGLLVIGSDPLRYLPGAYVQFLRIDGTELADPIRDREEIDGPLPDLMRRVEEKLKSHVSVRVSFASSPESRAPDYPFAALRQLAINAVLHHVQKFGTGIPIARQELRKNGNPELEFQVEDTYVLAIVRRAP